MEKVTTPAVNMPTGGRRTCSICLEGDFYGKLSGNVKYGKPG